MNQLFLGLLNRALISSSLILAVLIVRVWIKKAPRWITCVLWGLVAVKLIVPFQMESILSLIPQSQPIPVDIEYQTVPQINSGITVLNDVINPVLESNLTPKIGASVNPMQLLVSVAAMLWLTGAAVLCLYMGISYYLLRKRVSASQKLFEKVYLCDEIASPFILGVLRPRIYLPSGMEKDTMECVLEHERAHLKRWDHLWKPLGFVILTVYWFHPLCWIAYLLLCKDIECACDEKVTKDKDKEWKAAYCQALLDCNVRGRIIAACPVAFGEGSVKQRVKSVLHYQKPAFWMIALALVLSLTVAVCFMTTSKADPEESRISDEASEKAMETVKKWAQAVCDGDGDTIVSMASEEVLRQFEDMQVLERQEETVWFSFGSSPMLTWQEGIVPYTIVSWDEETHTADILYYAWTSDPHVFVWREQITLALDAEEAVVRAETMTFLDHISTMEEFLLAYPLGIKDTLMDYEGGNSFGEALNEHALSGNAYYQALLKPETAVYELLNIEMQENPPVKVEENGDQNSCRVRLQFSDGVLEVKLRQPFGEDGIWVPYDYNVVEQEKGSVSQADLESAISESILAHYDPKTVDGLFRTESHVILANEVVVAADTNESENVTVFLVALRSKYQMYQGNLETITEEALPLAITFTVDESGSYLEKEYWEPGDGSYYVTDVREKFPAEAAENALNAQQYLPKLQNESYEKAKAYFFERGDLKDQIEKLLAEIVSKTSASALEEAIMEHPQAYQELLDYDVYTLRYCFEQFLQGGQRDARAKLMEKLCVEIMGSWGVGHQDVLYTTGQDWFDAFLDNAYTVQETYSVEEIEKNYPAVWILLDLLDGTIPTAYVQER